MTYRSRLTLFFVGMSKIRKRVNSQSMSFNNTLSFVLVHEMNDGYSIHRSEYKKERPTDRFIGMKRTYF